MTQCSDSLNGLREKVLSLIALEKAHDDMGIYCQKVVGGSNPYERRTERMEGWNDYGTALTRKWCAISDWMEKIPPEYKADVEDFIMQDNLQISVNDKDIKLWVNCNDLFFWACADGEDFELSDIPDFKKAFADSPEHGDILWCCRKRGMRPQRPYYRSFNKNEKALFDAAGPERTDA